MEFPLVLRMGSDSMEEWAGAEYGYYEDCMSGGIDDDTPVVPILDRHKGTGRIEVRDEKELDALIVSGRYQASNTGRADTAEERRREGVYNATVGRAVEKLERACADMGLPLPPR